MLIVIVLLAWLSFSIHTDYRLFDTYWLYTMIKDGDYVSYLPEVVFRDKSTVIFFSSPTGARKPIGLVIMNSECNYFETGNICSNSQSDCCSYYRRTTGGRKGSYKYCFATFRINVSGSKIIIEKYFFVMVSNYISSLPKFKNHLW